MRQRVLVSIKVGSAVPVAALVAALVAAPVAAGCSAETSGQGGDGDGDGAATTTGGSASGGAIDPGSGGDGASNSGGTGSTTGGASSGGADSIGGGGDTSGSGGAASTGGSALGSGGADTSTGGSSGGATTCATADEGQGARLSCPEGQRIESVVFSSYGNPSGQCGDFMQGTCHASSSESAVADLCVGRASCTVPATNSMFSDPCNSTVKTLAVEVECVVGEPTVDPVPYKGIANSPAGEIDELGATWCYNWMSYPTASDCGDPLFVPMISGAGNVAGQLSEIAAAGYDTVLGFNEPNKDDQDNNISVADAIAQWPDITSDPNIRVGSPAVSDDGRFWLEDFMAQAQAGGLRVDFIAMHWYGWNEGSCTASQLEAAVNWASQWDRPVWITEFGCMGSSNTDEQTLLTFFDDAVQMLENHPQVERYAWYPWNTYNHLYLPDDSDVRQRTALGDAFLAAPRYR